MTNAEGRELPFAYSGDRLASVELPDGSLWRFTYDGSNINIFDPARSGTTPWRTLDSGAEVTYAYDGEGKLTAVKDENHVAPNTRYEYDPLDRLRTVRQTLASAPGGSITTGYRYDAQNNLAEVTDQNGNVTRYEYDDFGRLQKQTSPVTGVTTYSYDAAGNLVSTTDANGATTTRTWDALGRALSATSSRAGVPSETVSWTYDDPTAGHYGIGRLAAVTEPTGSTAYLYERRGLLAEERKTIEAATYVTQYTWDGNGNRAGVVAPTGRIESRSYDFADRPAGVTSAGTNLVSAARYLPFGPPTSWSFGNGTTRTMQYDLRYRPLRNTLAGGAGTIADAVYAADGVGNITQIHDAMASAFDRDFAYDDLNRLVTANSGASLWGAGSYGYDAMGNLLSLTLGSARTAAFSYLGTTPKLAAATENGVTRAVAYDPAGNELVVGGGTSAYSARNQLALADQLQYTYDGRGIRTITSAPPQLVAVSLDPVSVPGGSTSTGTILLSGPAPPGGIVVTLTSDTGSAAVPAQVLMDAGLTTGTFTVQTTPVSAALTATITASAAGVVRTASLSITPPRVASVSLTPSRVTGGAAPGGTVTLSSPAPSGGMSVSLSSSSAAASVPASVTVPAAATSASFPIHTTPVPTTTLVTIQATAGSSTASANLTIDPPAVVSLQLDPASVVAGTSTTATVLMSGPAPSAGFTVAVSSDNAAASVPSTVLVPAGASQTTFPVTTSLILTQVVAIVTASGGGGTASASLTINPPAIALAGLTVTPPSIVGGLPATGSVSLSNPAPVGGIVVALAVSDASLATVPTIVTVPQGATTATFPIETTTVLTPASVDLTATFGAVTRTAILTIEPPAGLALLRLEIDLTNVPGGTSTTATVTLTAPAPANVNVALATSAPGVAQVPATVRVKKNDTTATFTITTSPVPTAQTVTITGAYGGLPQHDALTVISPSAVQLLSLVLDPSTVVGGGTSSGTVTLSAPAPAGGLAVSLAVKKRNLASAPAFVLVPQGATQAMFAIATSLKWGSTDVTATYAGVKRTATLTVTRPVAAASNWNAARITLGVGTGELASRATLSASRIAITSSSGSPRHYSLYTPEMNLAAETETSASAAPAVAYEYVWFGGQPLAQIETATGAIHYYHNDHLGTPLLTTNATGVVDWRVEREPYGTRHVTRIGPSRHQPLGFPGQEEESTGERTYNIFRWYRAGWGRYSQSDPIGLGDRANLFIYVRDNPLRYFDRFGLWEVSDDYPANDDATVVCDGKGNVVPYVGASFFHNSKEKKCLGECVLMHEQAHANYANVHSPGVCKGKKMFQQVITSSSAEKGATEKQAYLIELHCLEGSSKFAPCEYKDLIDQRITQLEGILLSGNYAY